MYFFTFSLQPFLHAETTKVLETVLSQDILGVFPFFGALKQTYVNGLFSRLMLFLFGRITRHGFCYLGFYGVV